MQFPKPGLKTLGFISLLMLTACASAPQSQDHKQDHKSSVSTREIPAPVAITAQSLRLDTTINQVVDKGYVAGLSVLILKDGKESYYGQAGYRDLEAKIPLRRDDVGRYYSMTKPIIGVAMMMLYEQGKFALDDPIAKHLPEYTHLNVFAGSNADGSMKLAPTSRPVTIRDLMRHTAGMTYGYFSSTPVDMLYRKSGILSPQDTLAEFSQKLGKIPLLVQPGEKWIYSVSVDVQARLIEVLSGQSLGDFLESNIFKPLDMPHTGFSVKKEDFSKFGPAYVYNAKANPPALVRLTDKNSRAITRGIVGSIDGRFLKQRKLQSGGGGLVSSLDDYAHFAAMLVNKGSANGKQYLKPSTIALMSKDHLGNINNGALNDGIGFGLDVAVKTRDISSSKAFNIPVGSYYWGGLAGTFFWIDPSNNQAVIMHMQHINPLDPTLRNTIVNAVYGK